MLQSGGLLGVPQHGLDAIEVRGLHQVVAGARPQGGDRAVHRRVARDDDDFRRFWLVQLTHQLDALAVRQAQIRQQHIGALPPELDPGLPDAVGPGHGKPFHARDFLQPVHDIRVIVDNQSMCHLILGNLVRSSPNLGLQPFGNNRCVAPSNELLPGGLPDGLVYRRFSCRHCRPGCRVRSKATTGAS